MSKKKEYICPRCGYQTYYKSHIKDHLFGKKKLCPTSLHMIELTDEIKSHVLNFKVYHVPKSTSNQQTINNYNIMNNILSKMDVVDKINKYIEYKNIDLVDFEDKIEDKYAVSIAKLDNHKYNNFSLEKDDFLNIVDTLTTIVDVGDCNIIYHDILKKILVREDGKWVDMLLDRGEDYIVNKIQLSYLDSYEAYLIRKMFSNDQNSCFIRQQTKEHIQNYYKFISCFNCEPYVKNKSDNVLLGEEFYSETYDIEEELLHIYNNVQKHLRLYESNKIRREVIDIIKRNTKKSIVELNRKMMELFNMDEDFKTKVLQEIMCITGET